jgi:arsenate reductase-like glutaredoxin family protein
MDDAAIVERLLGDVRLLRLPLVRHGNEVTSGRAESVWKAWLSGSAVN